MGLLISKNWHNNKNGTATCHSFGYGGSGFKFNCSEDEALEDNIKTRSPNLVLSDKLNNHDKKIDCISNKTRFNVSLDEKLNSSRLESLSNNCLDSIPPIKSTSSIVSDEINVSKKASLQCMYSLPIKTKKTQNCMSSNLNLNKFSNPPNTITSLATIIAAQLVSCKTSIKENYATTDTYLENKTTQKLTNFKPMAYQTEVEINDFHQSVRWSITHKETLKNIADISDVLITIRGKHFGPFEDVSKGEKKLYLLLEGSTDYAVNHAKQLIRQIIEEQTEKAFRKNETIGKKAIV